MITVRLKGGLGNQMFQYAIGRYLAEKHKTKVVLDLTFLLNRLPRRNFVFRDYDLSIFNIGENFTFLSQLARTIKIIRDAAFPLLRFYLKIRDIFDKNYWIREKKDYWFDESILNLPDNIYLDGYWQSYKYFKDIEDIIRKEFTFKNEFDKNSAVIAERIKSNNAVCVHIRRTDYINISSNLNFFGFLETGYYIKAREIVASKVFKPVFFVFSDDIDWCQKNLKFNTETIFVEPGPAARDLYLMNLCRHFIICNSTFGWWAAWLSANPDKIVIAPKNWVRDPEINKNTGDLIPPEWIRI